MAHPPNGLLYWRGADVVPGQVTKTMFGIRESLGRAILTRVQVQADVSPNDCVANAHGRHRHDSQGATLTAPE